MNNDFSDKDLDTHTNLDASYLVPKTQNDPINIFKFVNTHSDDSAITVSLQFENYEKNPK